MKRMLPLILVFVLAVDLMEDGCFGKGPFYLSGPSSEIAITSSHNYHGSVRNDLCHALLFVDLPGSFFCGDTQPVTLHVLPTLRIRHCCHLNSSGGIPL